MIMGNFMLINACYGRLFIESRFILKEKMNTQVHMTYSKKAFIYLITKDFWRKVLCSNPAEDKIFK